MGHPTDGRLSRPPGAGDLVVSVAVRRYAGRAVGIWATVKDAAGHGVEAICSGTAGSQALRAQQAWARGSRVLTRSVSGGGRAPGHAGRLDGPGAGGSIDFD
jgi:hypothetical protein